MANPWRAMANPWHRPARWMPRRARGLMARGLIAGRDAAQAARAHWACPIWAKIAMAKNVPLERGNMGDHDAYTMSMTYAIRDMICINME